MLTVLFDFVHLVVVWSQSTTCVDRFAAIAPGVSGEDYPDRAGAIKDPLEGTEMNRRHVTIALLTTLLLMPWPQPSEAASRGEIEAGVNRTLRILYGQVGGTEELASEAAGVLVFPTVVKAGFGIGGEYGEGALRRGRRTVGYYNTVSASIGFQLGAQAKSVVIMFMTREALRNFQRKDGWKIGVDGSIALINVGVGGSVDSNQITDPIIGFVLGSKGLMYNLTLEGSKISQINR